MTIALELGLGRRLPSILQTEAAECGLACLAMLAGYHGQHTDMADLRRRFGLSLKGATLRDVARVADQLGFATRPLRLELDELPLLATPCILHWDLNHFVVLREVGRRGAVVHDPAVGERRLTVAELGRHFTGVALECTPLAGFQRAAAAPRARLSALIGRVEGLGGALAQLFLLALGIEALAIASPLLMQWVVDDALVGADRELLLALVVGFSLLLGARVSVTAMRGWVLMTLGACLKLGGRANLLSHLLRLPASYFESRQLGDVISRFGSQDDLLQALTTDAVEVVLDGLFAALTLGVMFLFAPGLTWLVIGGAALYAVLRCVSYEPLRRASAEAIVWAARRDSHFIETLRGVKTIKLLNGEEDRRGRWLNLMVETINRQLTTRKLGLLLRAASSLLKGGLAIAVVWLGAGSVLDGALSVGMLLAFIAYKDQFLDRTSGLVNKLLELRLLSVHAERLADIALTSPEGTAPPEPGAAAPAAASTPTGAVVRRGVRRPATLELRDVRFRYGEHEPWLLDGLSLRVEAGESVAIVGPSGCGKTTLLKVMASLLRPSEGELLVDGQRLGTIGLPTYRAMIGVVMQDDQLFAGSIGDNISFFAERPVPVLIEAAAQLAGIHEEIAAMAMGYSTLIGDMGTVLSGGQKQRVLLARALYRGPSLLLLDEATSHLDIARERAVSQALADLQVTKIIVAHRPETIRSAGRVLRLERGRIVSDEPRAALAPRRGLGRARSAVALGRA
ncbi:MAG: peptidase domain-containing ABC transporter [Planctomycetota bacterium]